VERVARDALAEPGNTSGGVGEVHPMKTTANSAPSDSSGQSEAGRDGRSLSLSLRGYPGVATSRSASLPVVLVNPE
jgi:hypothetical protein